MQPLKIYFYMIAKEKPVAVYDRTYASDGVNFVITPRTHIKIRSLAKGKCKITKEQFADKTFLHLLEDEGFYAIQQRTNDKHVNFIVERVCKKVRKDGKSLFTFYEKNNERWVKSHELVY